LLYALNKSKKENERLKAVFIPAEIYHYGWVRPPEMMSSKKRTQDSMHWGIKKASKYYKDKVNYYEYGPLGRLPFFKGTHPKVMSERIKQIHWKDKLDYGKKLDVSRPLSKHERFKYRFLTNLENTFFGGKEIFGYSNWIKIKR